MIGRVGEGLIINYYHMIIFPIYHNVYYITNLRVAKTVILLIYNYSQFKRLSHSMYFSSRLTKIVQFSQQCVRSKQVSAVCPVWPRFPAGGSKADFQNHRPPGRQKAKTPFSLTTPLLLVKPHQSIDTILFLYTKVGNYWNYLE